VEIFKNQYYSLSFYHSSTLLIYVAFPQTENMTKEDLEEGFVKTSEIMEELKPRFFLSDARQQLAVISPKIQLWIAQNIYPRWQNAGLQKLAIVIPTELIANLSIQQTVDEVEEVKKDGYEIRYFDDDKVAKNWLAQ
jgi:hypothetical protein